VHDSVHFLGLPSAPGLTAVAVDLDTFGFTISSPEPSQCTFPYLISVMDGRGSLLSNISVAASESMPVNESGFDICNNNYSFSVVAETSSGPGERSATITPEAVDFLSEHFLGMCVCFKINLYSDC